MPFMPFCYSNWLLQKGDAICSSSSRTQHDFTCNNSKKPRQGNTEHVSPAEI